MSDLTLLEEDDFSTSDDAVANDNAANNSKGLEEVKPPKKAAKNRTVKDAGETAKIAKAAAKKVSKETIKKAAPKKVNEKKIESLEPKAVKPKKVATAKIATAAEKKATPAKTTKITRQAVVAEATPVVNKANQLENEEKQSDQSEIAIDLSNTHRSQSVEIAAAALPEITISPVRKITFQIKFHTVFGQSLFVLGDHPLLGNNQIESAFPLSYLNDNYWSGTIEIPEEQRLKENIAYHYILKNIDGTISEDWGTDKVIIPGAYKHEEILLIDTWNPSSAIENIFYTEPFQEVLLKENFTEIETTIPEKVTHVFRAKAPLLQKGQALCILGAASELGEWKIEKPLLLSRKQGEAWHSISLDLSNAIFPFAYKYGLFDVDNNAFIDFETGSNRTINNGSSQQLTVVSDGFAAINGTPYKGAGVAIPVFSLRTTNG